MSFDHSFSIPFIPLTVRFMRVESGLDVEAIRMGALTARVALVCDTGLTQYVRVEPKYVWLVPELDFTADTEVFSNVEWNVS